MTDNVIEFDRLIEIACTSRNPVAKRFKRWLFREVLPELRRTRSYAGSTAPLEAFISELTTGERHDD
jgi:prophage antirepressor-like protein